MDLAIGRAGILDVSRCIFKDAVGSPDVDKLLTHGTRVDDTVVG